MTTVALSLKKHFKKKAMTTFDVLSYYHVKFPKFRVGVSSN